MLSRNAIALFVIALGILSLDVGDPHSTMDSASEETRSLYRLERWVSDHPEDIGAHRSLMQRYLDLRRADLVLALANLDESVVDHDPRALDLLARAHEQGGDIGRALSLVDRARALCVRTVGGTELPVPVDGAGEGELRCSAHRLAALAMHREALVWLRDRRAGVRPSEEDQLRAYTIAVRSVSLQGPDDRL